MEPILQAREILIKLYKRLEVFIQPGLKFFLGLYVFTRLIGLGHVHPALAEYTETMTSTLVAWLFALLFTVMPTNLSWLLIILTLTVQVSATVELAVIVFLFTLFIFIFYARMAPRESFLIIFTMIAFQFNVPYLIPLIVGLYFSVTAIIPVTLGVFLNAKIPVIHDLMAPQATLVDVELTDLPTLLPEIFTDVYTTLISSLGVSEWLITAVVFSLVIILVHVASRQSIDYAKEIAIALGCVMTIFGFIMSVAVATDTVSIGSVIIWTTLSGLIAMGIKFFDSVLDYNRAESVQFEDDDNYYHVRIVPKVVMLREKPKRKPRPKQEEPQDENDTTGDTLPATRHPAERSPGERSSADRLPTERPRPRPQTERERSRPASDDTRYRRPAPTAEHRERPERERPERERPERERSHDRPPTPPRPRPRPDA